MMSVYDIAIIGGGIAGCNMLRELSQQCPDARLILLEKGKLASETTGDSGGFIWPDHSDIAKASFQHYQILGDKIDFTKLSLIHTQAGQTSGLIAGRINTLKYCEYCVDHAQKLGATALCNTPVLAIHMANQITLNTPKQDIQAKQVVLATGFNLDLLPKDLKLQNYSFQYNCYSLAVQASHAMIDLDQDIYALPLPNQQLIAGFLSQDKAFDGAYPQIDIEQASAIDALIQANYPSAKRLQTKINADSFTANEVPLFAKDKKINRVYYAIGLSSGGIKYTPYLAKQLSEIICAAQEP